MSVAHVDLANPAPPVVAGSIFSRARLLIGTPRESGAEGAAMGFVQPNLPVVDMAEWSKKPRAERVVPMVRHIAENGFGTPLIMHVMYGIKIALYILGAWLFVWSTNGIDGFTKVAAWWTEPDRKSV